MSTTRQFPPGEFGSEPDGAGTTHAGPESRVRTLALGSASGIVPMARDFTRQALYDWGWLPAESADRRAAAEDVLLVVSELVTNACLHAEGPEQLRVSSDTKALRLEVTDRGTGQPAPRTPHRAGRPRRARDVHRAAALPGLGCVPYTGSPRQDGLGGPGGPGLVGGAARAPTGARRLPGSAVSARRPSGPAPSCGT